MTEQSPQRYEAICDASPDAILLVDSTGEITYANARVEGLFGYEPEELLGEPIERLVPEPIRDEHVPLRNGYLADPQTRPMGASLDLEAQRKDGTTVSVDISLSPIPGDGEAAAMAAVRNITERTDLRRKYRTILEASPDAVIVAETQTGEIVETNGQVTDLFGYNPAELIGERQPILHPSGEEDRYRSLFESHIEACEAILSELPDGSPIYIETKAGDHVPVEINARVFELDDKQMITGVFRDVSARHEYERQLEALHAASRQFYHAETRDELAELVSEVTETILAFEHNVVRLVTEGDRLHPVATSGAARTAMGSRPDYPTSDEVPAGRAYQQGEPLVVEDLTTIEDEFTRGNVGSAMYVPIGEYGVLSIVDPRKGAFTPADVELASIVAANARSALTRLDTQAALEREIDRLDTFASIVSHDLQNPLNVAEGWLDIARDKGGSEELQRVSDALDRMNEIVEYTLLLARAGKTVGEKETIELRDFAEECWRHVSMGDAKLKIETNVTIYGDRGRLQHLLENLYRNAMEHGGDDVTITVGGIDDSGFYVEDNGPGIPEDERDEVFQTGFTTSASGTGFGLSIVKEVVDAHGWDIRVTESADGGARFEITGVEFT